MENIKQFISECIADFDKTNRQSLKFKSSFFSNLKEQFKTANRETDKSQADQSQSAILKQDSKKELGVVCLKQLLTEEKPDDDVI